MQLFLFVELLLLLHGLLLYLLQQGFVKHLVGSEAIDFVPSASRCDLLEYVPDITVKPSYLQQNIDELAQLRIVLIVIPADAGKGVLRLEEIRVWRIVNYDDVLDIAA